MLCMAATTKRVRLSPVARRAQLIALGVEMLARRTLDELSVEEIAAQAGISRGLLFHYFSSKQEFHVEVARAAAQQLLDRTAPDPALPPAEALRNALVAYIDYVEENPDNYKSLVRGAASGAPEMRHIFDDTRSQLGKRIIAVVGELGLALGPRAEIAVYGWVAFCEEVVIRWLDSREFDREHLVTLLGNALPAVALASQEEQVTSLVALLSTSTDLAAN
jgi:AcrR family transcriptional regulator